MTGLIAFPFSAVWLCNLQDQIDKINKNDYIIVAGDYNARVGKIPIDGILGTNVKSLLTVMDTN